MNNEERLTKLKILRVSEDEKQDKISKLSSFTEWADNVAPLLKYDNDHYETFIQAVNTAKMPLSGKSISYYLSIAISTVNQAIIELENGIASLGKNSVSYAATNPPNSKTPNSKEKKSISLINIAEGVIIGVLVLCIAWILFHYFGIS